MKSSEWTTAELLQVCTDTNATEGWAEFIARYQPLIAGVIARIATRHRGRADSGLVDDLVQETYLRLCRDACRVLRQFRLERGESIFGYLKVVASSVALDYFRAQGAEKRGPEPVPLDDITERHSASRQVPAENVLLLTEMWRCLDSFVENDRDGTIFRLYYQQGFTAKEISAIPSLNLSEKGVESCLHRLTSQMREALRLPARNKGKSPQITLGDMQ